MKIFLSADPQRRRDRRGEIGRGYLMFRGGAPGPKNSPGNFMNQAGCMATISMSWKKDVRSGFKKPPRT
jgi:hypothetical protein